MFCSCCNAYPWPPIGCIVNLKVNFPIDALKTYNAQGYEGKKTKTMYQSKQPKWQPHLLARTHSTLQAGVHPHTTRIDDKRQRQRQLMMMTSISPNPHTSKHQRGLLTCGGCVCFGLRSTVCNTVHVIVHVQHSRRSQHSV